MRAWFLLFALVACGDDDKDTDTGGDTDADTDTDTDSDTDTDTTPPGTLCELAEEPVTWESFGEAFFTTNCQPCHSVDATNRNGAPDGVNFDTEAEVLYWAPSIVNIATGSNPQMPPGGGVSDEDRTMLEIYLLCPP